ncbi:PPC domain-containing protein [Iningainema tapete]|uniref:PPC domain-containing protein n=1 Tax=Iningainema tapete BLCC-T55 TaxID=2748662 RepID=A0A8J6XKD9_9CYAN|nr:PPC domain-containing protein [Iningainema tapete]MBD2773149.1 PPC domain-containing protein [Iningainema tapete BLCC-T55]
MASLIDSTVSSALINYNAINDILVSDFTRNIGTLTDTAVTRNGYSVTPSDPTDVFKFNVGSNSHINLALTNISAGDDADLRLYRDNGNGYFDSNDTLVSSSVRGSNNDDAINVAAQSAGTYFAEVSRYAPGSSGNVTYNLALSTASPSNLLANEYEVGNLSGDRTYYGAINNSNAADVYHFSLGFYEGVNINLTGLSADADIRLIQDGGNRIVELSEVIRTSTNGGSLSESISGFDLSGDYYLQVYQYGNSSTNYTLNFDYFPTTYA